ncbi:MAG: zinc ribbon domain-containing protein [Verrucomicrobia bacterium]|nr:zinc ribbon domain-containing protein [Verrucomicrobiota bacterium]MBU4289612.1 zinc ribbon domain-containing protein [Verrucomicrobiota bacterium]MBU4428159.1 zinc ribbon domain-containing protein [Verrucomicrobiota bacterium]MCG2680206.1 zinc ribbon domain-containing protein [Kiritimatiellia bacterium]
MPTYEYECKQCRKTFDVFQNITAKPLKQCPVCKGKVRRLIGKGAGIIFKGSGFYQTDYRSDHYRKRVREEKKPAETSGPKKEGGGASVSKDSKASTTAKE